MLFDILHGHDVPTSVVVVVTPLVAIMKEQVSELGANKSSSCMLLLILTTSLKVKF